MRILLLGSGGREHAFALKINESKKLRKLFIAPGNGGTHSLGENVNIDNNNFEAIKTFVINNNINCVVVGPEAPLVNGIVDFFENDEQLNNVLVIGPNKKAATLEGSKAFSKEFMQRYNIPTATYKVFTKKNLQDAINYIQSQKTPIVLKADGLAAGKGVLICQNHNEAINEIEAMLSGKFGNAGSTVVIEEFLDGIEFSAFAIADGKSFQLLPTAKDYKRIGEGDKGLNTGGMGSVAPAPFVNEMLLQKTINKVIQPTFEGLKKEGIEYIGFLFFGLMVVNNKPYVIEYNCRMGDPETQSVFSLIENDFIEIFDAIKYQTINQLEINTKKASAATIVLASGGYPENHEKGFEITGINAINDSTVFHAGTKLENGKLVTSGGRVLAVTSTSSTLKHALETSNKNAEKITYTNKYYRKDIGWDVL